MHCLEVYLRLRLSGSSLFILTQRSNYFDGMSTAVSVAVAVTLEVLDTLSAIAFVIVPTDSAGNLLAPGSFGGTLENSADPTTGPTGLLWVSAALQQLPQ